MRRPRDYMEMTLLLIVTKLYRFRQSLESLTRRPADLELPRRLTPYRAYRQPQNLPADPVYHPKDPVLSNLSLGSTPFISPSQFEALRTTTT